MMNRFARSLLFSVLFLAGTGAAVAATRIQDLDYIAAVVNDDVITHSELDRRVHTVEQQLSDRNTRLPPADVLRRQVLERMIMERLELQEADHSGIRVDDETVTRVVAKLAGENHLTLPQFKQALEREGMDFGQFRENIRNQVMISRLRQREVERHVSVTQQEIQNQLANMASRGDTGREYHLGHILIAVPEAASPEQIQKARQHAETVLKRLRTGADFGQTAVAESDGQQALQGGDIGWRRGSQLPTAIGELVAKMNPGDVSPPLRSASGFHLFKLLAVRDNEQHIVKQALVRHILIRPNQIVSDSEARQRLERLRQRIVQGDDFAKLATAQSDDKASAAEGGSLGWVSPGEMVPEFEQVMNSLQPGEISEPFRTQYGWHIVQVMARRNHDETEAVKKNRAREAVRQRKTDEALESWLRQLRDQAYVDVRLDKA